MDSKDNEIKNEESNGILLYYKYAPIPNISSLVSFYESNCKSLGLLGRVRIASNGVNVTVGGKMSSLEKHIEVMKSDKLFEGIDFKLASCDGPSDEGIARECGFTYLSVRVVKELVTFRSDPALKPPEISHAGRHLSAIEFHSVLQDAAGRSSDSQASMQRGQLLLLDARNLYETRIGKFQNPNVETLDPEIRQYSDLPAWIDNHSEQLRGKHVLMYCTGGIRCETASAYIRSKGAGYDNVFQLYGGIQRYMEQFPDGGFFKGKNFVFDHRISVGSQDTDIVGACLICGTSFDNYSSCCRCTHCRMLVLVCNSFQGNTTIEYICELCKKHREGRRRLTFREDGQLQLFDLLESGEVVQALPSVHVASSSIILGTHGALGLYHGIASNITSSAPISAIYTYTSVNAALLPILPKVGKNYLDSEWKQELITFSQFLERIKSADCPANLTYLAQHPLFDQPLPAEEERDLEQTLKEILPNAKSVQIEQKAHEIYGEPCMRSYYAQE